MDRETHYANKTNGFTVIRGDRLQDQRNPHITLKQWRAFHAVVNYGGYMDAAESLHLSQSTISYMLAKLQQQLGIPLLRLEGRKATITEEGRLLLDRSRNLLRDAAELELFAESLRRGQARELRVAVHRDFPTSYLTRALDRMRLRGMPVPVALSELSQRRVVDALQQRRVDLAVAAAAPPGFEARPLLEVEYSLVVHPGNALARATRPIRKADLADQVEVIVQEDSDDQETASGTRIQSKRWTLASLDSAVDVLGSGVGYARLPSHRLQPWIERGLLTTVETEEPVTTRLFHLVYTPSIRKDSAEHRLVDELLGPKVNGSREATAIAASGIDIGLPDRPGKGPGSQAPSC